MLIPNQMIEVRWHNQTKDWYEQKGYHFTKIKDYFYVKAEDLSIGSRKMVRVICDYCGEEYTTQYVNYLNQREYGDCCIKCVPQKRAKVMLDRYGVENPMHNDALKKKQKDSIIEKYGVENVFQNEEVKDKIHTSIKNKYGVDHISQSNVIKNKIKQTSLERYGVENPSQSNEVKKKIATTNIERYGNVCSLQGEATKEKTQETFLNKYGVDHPFKNKEVQRKIRETLCKNGSIPISKAEEDMVKLLQEIYGKENCIPQYPLDNINFDCLVVCDGVKIDVEYDGYYWHKNKQLYDNNRNGYVLKQGYRVLRFVANNNVPTKEQIIECVDYLVKGNHHIKILELDV